MVYSSSIKIQIVFISSHFCPTIFSNIEASSAIDMIKLLSLTLAAWFGPLSHVIYLYLFLLCEALNEEKYIA